MTGFNSKRQAAQPQAEPVAWRRPGKHFGYVYEDGITSFAFDSSATPLYTHPAAPVPAAPDGWVLVPIEATKAMCVAAVKLYNGDAVYKNVLQGVLDIEEEIYAEVYESMIAAAPVFEEHDMDDDGGCPVCGADGGTSCGMPNCGLLSAAPAVQSAARAIAAEQAEDTGLWFVATTVSEAHLQAALRRLTAAVEGEAP